MRDLRLPDDTVVRGASLADRDLNADWRGYGLYLDARWAPRWPAEVVSWPDLGVPDDLETAARAIHRAYLLAREGANVEVGCLAGLGRTGTVLACMAVLAGVEPEDATAWVREHYARSAVETSEQERWVARFGALAGDCGWLERAATSEEPGSGRQG